jgi:hypothetical protein
MMHGEHSDLVAATLKLGDEIQEMIGIAATPVVEAVCYDDAHREPPLF